VQEVRKKLAADITVPMKVAVMGCVVNGPGEAEGADVAVFAGDLVVLRAAGLVLPVAVRLPATGLPVVRRVRPAVFFFAVFLLLVGIEGSPGPEP